MKYLILCGVFAFFAVGNGQYGEWGCNHFGNYPTDTCIPWSSYYDDFYYCNGTDLVQLREYEAGDCDAGGDPRYVYSYDLTSSTWSDYGECGNAESCDYWWMLCGDVIALGPFAIGVCYDSLSTSFVYACVGSRIGYYVYSDSGDCSGDYTGVTVDYGATYTDDCYSFYCSDPGNLPSGGSSSGTTHAPGDIVLEGTVSCGEEAVGSIQSYGIDFYEFVIEEEYPIVQFSTCGSIYDTYLYLYENDYTGDDADLYYSCDDCGDCGTRTMLSFSRLAVGTYYIGVGGFGSDSGAYKLDVNCGETTAPPQTTDWDDDSNNPYADWECNHLLNYPLPMPCLYSGWFSITAECIDDEDVLVSYYDTNDCTGELNRTEIFNSTWTSEGSIKCSYDTECGYYSFGIYNGTDQETDDDCSEGNVIYSGSTVVGHCSSIYYGWYNYSYLYGCQSDGDITYKEYNCAKCEESCLESEDETYFADSLGSFADEFCATFICDETAGSGSGGSGSGESDDGNSVGVSFFTFCLLSLFVFCIL